MMRCFVGAMVWVATSVVAGTLLTAGERARDPKVLADFNVEGAVKWDATAAEAVLVDADGGKALKIRTEADADYPSVFLRPPQGRWDLRAFDAVEIDIYNPQEKMVRVLLSLNNPGSDGQRGCNCESVQCPPKGRVKLTVPFGMWHGNSNHPIDQANIEAIQVLLDRPKQAHTFVVDNVRAVVFSTTPPAEVLDSPFFKKLTPTMGRGINLGNALEAPREGEWGVVLKEHYFEAIKKAGFDSVRIPARWSNHAEKASPYRIDEKFFERVEWAVRQALDRKLLVVLNVHHYEELMTQPDAHRERFLALWEQIAARFKDYPAELAFELCNEPHDKLTADKWNALLADALKIVRRTNPTRQVVVGAVGWNSIKDLPSLVLPEDDRNLIVTFHYYNPFHFTHQGASWVGADSQKWRGTKWTGTAAERLAVCRELNDAIAWAVKHQRPIFMGEFGAFSEADMESRARWTQFVADEALARKIGFAYWEFCSSFGAYDPAKEQWIAPLRNALVPNR